jgi:carbohydrate-binding DOMON domain-containing protein
LKKPSHRLLTNSDIKASALNARVLYEKSDPENDDVGTGPYLYPSTPNLRPGSLDVKRFSVSETGDHVHFALEFRNLSNPGWHPEYGFQLTFSAIAIDKDGKAGSGQAAIGRNAGFTLPQRHAYESIVYVGGGIRLEDARGALLAEYRPVQGDEENPLGNAANKSISFSIPRELVGQPQASWNYTVLVGAQDDHGGAGIGDFRAVQATGGEWTGGGKKRSSDPNVYDVILPKQ